MVRGRQRVRFCARVLLAADSEMAAAGWSTEATRALVSVWGQQNVQNQLDGVSRNRAIFERISRELRNKGYGSSAGQK